jgi:hypothetical protein
MESAARPARTPDSPTDAGEPALRLPATPYAVALRRYLESVRSRDFAAALSAINEAVALEPGLVEPLRSRAILWQLMGDYVRCASDWAACSAIDPHHREADAIRTAAQQLRLAYEQDPVLGSDLVRNTSANPRLRAALDQRIAEIHRRRMLLARPACDLPCPSSCCRFEDETFTYGVVLNEDEFEKVRAHLRDTAGDEAEFIAVVGDHGRHRVHFPLRAERTSAPPDDGWHPRNGAYRELSWVTRRSRPCVFVGPTGCAIHDVGDPPGITACRSFLCLTALVCLLLRDAGATRAGDFADRSMAELHEFALTALPLLAARFCSPAVTAAQQEMRNALVVAAELDASSGNLSVDEALDAYDAACRRSLEAARVARRELDQVVTAFIERR